MGVYSNGKTAWFIHVISCLHFETAYISCSLHNLAKSDNGKPIAVIVI